MRVDLYTKVVLTVIAMCLVWLCLDRSQVSPVAHAQNEYQRMVIVGWQTANGEYVNFPNVDRGTRSAGLPVLTAR